MKYIHYRNEKSFHEVNKECETRMNIVLTDKGESSQVRQDEGVRGVLHLQFDEDPHGKREAVCRSVVAVASEGEDHGQRLDLRRVLQSRDKTQVHAQLRHQAKHFKGISELVLNGCEKTRK